MAPGGECPSGAVSHDHCTSRGTRGRYHRVNGAARLTVHRGFTRSSMHAAWRSSVHMRAIVVAVTLALLLPTTAQAGDGLPLGPAGVHETRTSDVLAPGVTYTRIARGHLSPGDGWAVDVAVVAVRAPFATRSPASRFVNDDFRYTARREWLGSGRLCRRIDAS